FHSRATSRGTGRDRGRRRRAPRPGARASSPVRPDAVSTGAFDPPLPKETGTRSILPAAQPAVITRWGERALRPSAGAQVPRPASASGLRAHAKRSRYQPVSGVSVTPWLDEWTNQPLPA